MNKAEAKREACGLIGDMVLAAPGDVIANASAEYETEADEQRMYEALEEVAHQLIARSKPPIREPLERLYKTGRAS